MEKLFTDKGVKKLVKTIAVEFENRNLFPLTSFPQYVNKKVSDEFNKNCFKLHSIIRGTIEDKDFFEKIVNSKNIPWVGSALWFGSENGKYNLNKVTTHLCIYLIQQQFRNIDDYIEHLQDNSICEELSILTDKNLLVDLSDSRLKLKNHGIMFESSTLIYPHQFFRRFYSANFVGMPSLLRMAHESGIHVHIKVDPFRKTLPNHYREIMEFDYWHGPRFSKKLLMNKYLDGRTLHASRGYYCFSYEVGFTVFRTKMIQDSIREFIIEEYCPLQLPYKKKSPGVGKKFCIQKFAHFCYEQKKECFTHLDGAVRVFRVEEYRNCFNRIKSGIDVDDKIGIRYKMFLMEGKLDKHLAEEILTEWFRYNPHIQEYFSGIDIDPLITYQDFEKSHS